MFYFDLEYLDLATLPETREMFYFRHVQWMYDNVDLNMFIEPIVTSYNYFLANNNFRDYNECIRKSLCDEMLDTSSRTSALFTSVFMQYADRYRLGDDTAFSLYRIRFVPLARILDLRLLAACIERDVARVNSPASLRRQAIKCCSEMRTLAAEPIGASPATYYDRLVDENVRRNNLARLRHFMDDNGLVENLTSRHVVFTSSYINLISIEHLKIRTSAIAYLNARIDSLLARNQRHFSVPWASAIGTREYVVRCPHDVFDGMFVLRFNYYASREDVLRRRRLLFIVNLLHTRASMVNMIAEEAHGFVCSDPARNYSRIVRGGCDLLIAEHIIVRQ